MIKIIAIKFGKLRSRWMSVTDSTDRGKLDPNCQQEK